MGYIHFGQQTMNPLLLSSRSLRSMGFPKRTFTKSTRSASGGKCLGQLSLPVSALPLSFQNGDSWSSQQVHCDQHGPATPCCVVFVLVFVERTRGCGLG